jgi:hypothetical protein
MGVGAQEHLDRTLEPEHLATVRERLGNFGRHPLVEADGLREEAAAMAEAITARALVELLQRLLDPAVTLELGAQLAVARTWTIWFARLSSTPRTRCIASRSSSSAASTSPLDIAMSAHSTNVFFFTASLEMSERAFTASCPVWNFARSFFAAAICASKSASLNSGSVLMNASSVAISEPSR